MNSTDSITIDDYWSLEYSYSLLWVLWILHSMSSLPISSIYSTYIVSQSTLVFI